MQPEKVETSQVHYFNIPLYNSNFPDYVDCIYPIDREIKDTTDKVRFASYLDQHLEIDDEGRLRKEKNA